MVPGSSCRPGDVMPTDPAAGGGLPPDSRQRGYSVVTMVLFVAAAGVLGYAALVADDLSELVLDLVVLVLGVLVAVSATSHTLDLVHLRLHAAERRVEVMSASDLMAWECDAHGRVVFFGEQAHDYFG